VVDAGCNVGILAYEISKRGAAFIHALDGSPQMLAAAKLIFRSVDTPHRLDLVNLANDRCLRGVLRPAYDIVQLLAVYQHVERARGDALAATNACYARRALHRDLRRRLESSPSPGDH
jgi:2-polyprenyl-3-methyl-5-hydroxy-6-metoxy-1,4-benzoquinol methylase